MKKTMKLNSSGETVEILRVILSSEFAEVEFKNGAIAIVPFTLLS